MSDGTAWVIGGGTGIGLGIATALADDGYTVYISGRRRAVLDEAAATVNHGRLVPLPADVTKSEELTAAAGRIREAAGKLDVLVVSAGINVRNRTVADTTEEEWRRVMEINATGPFLALKAALPLLREADAGLVVNISSIAGLRALAMAGAAYVASKFASSAVGIFAGNELAEAGIRVTTIYPGEVSTPILDERAVPPTPEKRAQMVQPHEVGALVSLIARLPSTAHVSELVIKPRYQGLV